MHTVFNDSLSLFYFVYPAANFSGCTNSLNWYFCTVQQLKAYNPYYSNITIDEDSIPTIPEKGAISHMLLTTTNFTADLDTWGNKTQVI